MKAKALKKLLVDVADDVEIVVPGPDHSYYRVEAQVAQALRYADGGFCEYHGTEEDDTTVVAVVVVS